VKFPSRADFLLPATKFPSHRTLFDPEVTQLYDNHPFSGCHYKPKRKRADPQGIAQEDLQLQGLSQLGDFLQEKKSDHRMHHQRFVRIRKRHPIYAGEFENGSLKKLYILFQFS